MHILVENFQVDLGVCLQAGDAEAAVLCKHGAPPPPWAFGSQLSLLLDIVDLINCHLQKS